MFKEILNVHLYGGHRSNSKRLLGKWPVETQLSSDGERAVWKVRKKYQFVYTAKDDMILTGIELSIPNGIRTCLSLTKQLPMPTYMPITLQKGNTVTILFDRWQQALMIY